MSKHPGTKPTSLPSKISLKAELQKALKYGENPYMSPAGFYVDPDCTDPLAIGNFIHVQGDAPSAINILDVNRLLQTMRHICAGFQLNFGYIPYVALVVKHGNVCGAGVGNTAAQAIKRMVVGDRRAQFGGVIMCNFALDTRLTNLLKTHQKRPREIRMFDTIAAAGFEGLSIKLLERKKGKCRLLQNVALATEATATLDQTPRPIPVTGGYVYQPNYTFVLDLNSPDIVHYGNKLTLQQKMDVVLAWAIGATSNSNTMTGVLRGMLLGNGVGQQDRVGAAQLAIKRARDAGHDLSQAVFYSDSFCPFPDAPRALVRARVAVFFTSSGSQRDQDTIDVCTKAKLKLLMMPDALCRGFAMHT